MKILLRFFKNNIKFHKLFHDTKIVKIENDKYLFCNTCQRYIPSVPVGRCVKCGCKIITFKNYCNKCLEMIK
jgi:hypothetical protein